MNTLVLKSPAFLAALALMLGSAGAFNAGVSALKLHLRKKPIEVDLKVQAIPSQTDSWKQVGSDRAEDAAIVEELGTTNYLNRRYVRIAKPESNKTASGKPDAENREPEKPVVLDLHLAYYTGMVDTVPHVPERCMVGGGWSIANGPFLAPVTLNVDRWSIDRDATAEFASQSSPIYRARLLNGLSARMPRGVENLALFTTEFSHPKIDTKLIAGYFFIANGGISSTAEGVRLLAFDLRADYAFYLKVQISSATSSSAEQLARDAADLLNELLPEIMQTVPDWIEVQRGLYPPDNPRRPGAPKS